MRSQLADSDSPHVPGWVLAADILAVACWVVALAILIGGGQILYLGDLKISLRSAPRGFLLGGVIALIRLALNRQPSPLISALLRVPSLGPAVRQAFKPRPLVFEEERLFGSAPSAWPARIREFCLLTVAYAVLVVIGTWPQAVTLQSVSDLGDPLFSVWRLMWLLHEFPQDPLNIFNTNQFYPEPRTLAYSDPTLGPALLFAPLYGLGLTRYAAYNLVFLSGGLFSGVGTFYLVRALTGRADAAFVSGAIYAVYPYRLEHFAHIELQMTMWVPIALWCLHRTLASGRLRDGVAMGLATAAQFYWALYYGAFLMTYACVIGVVLWLARGRPWRPLRSLAVGAVLAGVLFSPVAAVFLKQRGYMGNRSIGEVTFYSAVGPDYTQSHYRSSTYRSWSHEARPERSLFPRFTPLVLLVFALWPPLSVARMAYLLALAFSVEVSFGVNGSIFPILYEWVPPYGGIRVPARYSVMAGLSLAVLAGYGAARLFSRWPRARVPLFAAMVLAVAVESVPDLQLVEAYQEPPPIYASLPSDQKVVLAEFPMPGADRNGFSEFAYLYFSTFHWSYLVNGQSGWLPPTYHELVDNMRSFPSDEAVAYLRSRGVQYLSVHGAFYPEGRRDRVLAEFDARPELEQVSAVQWRGSQSRLYRLR